MPSARSILLTILLMTPSVGGVAAELLPQGRLFKLTFADPQEIRMVASLQSHSKLHGIIGNYFSLLGFGDPKLSVWRVVWGIEGRIFATLRQEGGRFPLETVDGMLGTYLEASVYSWQFQLRYTHVSGHLADGLTQSSNPFSREFATFRVGYSINPYTQLYVGASNLVHVLPQVQPWAVQVGGYYFLPLNFWATPFGAVHAEWREEWNRTSVSAQLGIALNNPVDRYRSFRIYYGFYTGGDYRGQFFGQPVTLHSLGFEMQL